MPRKAKLPNQAKEAIVRALACFDPPSAIVATVRKEFGVTVTRQTVQGYDPTKTAGRRCAHRWQQLFEATRRAFVRDTSEIAIAHRTVRLRALSRIAVKAEDAGNLALAVQVYEVAAKECGDAFTNRRQLSGPNGMPLQVQPVVPAITSEMSHAEAAELYRQTLVENGFP